MKKTLTTAMLIAMASVSAQAQLFDRIDSTTPTQPAQSSSVENSTSPQSQPHLIVNNAQSDLIAYMQNSQEIEADFQQITYNQRGEETSTGHMWIAKPNKFFWDYRTPYEQQIISDGKNVYHYDKDLEQITVRSKDELVGDVAIRLLEGEESLSDEFNIKKLSQANVPSFIDVNASNAEVYALNPINETSEYNGVWVVLQANELSQVIVDGGTGQQTIMSFTNLRRNHGIAADKFNFNPPQGVDVVGNIVQ